MPLYLAGRHPYLRQLHDPGMIAVTADQVGIEKNGLEGLREIDAWVRRDADYAVVQPSLMRHYRPTRGAAVERIETRLARHFEPAAVVEEYRWWVYEVYARRSRARP